MSTVHFRTAILTLGLFVLGCGNSDKGDDDESNGGGGGGDKSVALGSCQDTFTPCGGDPTGFWVPDKTCIDGSLTEAVDAAFSDYPSCKGSVREAGMNTVAGVTYTANTYDRTGSVTLTSKLEITAECFAEQLRGTALSDTTCGYYSQVLDSQAGMQGQCTYNGTTCNCETTTIQSLNASGNYSVNGTTLTEDNGNELEFCVAGDQLSYRSVLIATQNNSVRVSGVAIMKHGN